MDGFELPARRATAISLTAVGLVVAVQVAVPGGWGRTGWPLLLCGLLLGVPHGAVDHLVPAYRLGWRLLPVALFTAGYAALAATAWGLFAWAPGPALAVFVAVSIWHFGSGETAFADLRARRSPRARPASSLVLGCVVLLLPLTRGLADPRGAVSSLTSAIGGGWDAARAAQLASWVAGAVVVAAAVLLVRLLLRRRWLPAGELTLLLALGLVVPPLAAFGVYFGVWHGVRHLARVVAENPANAVDLAAGRLRPPLRRLVAAAAVPTTAVLAVVAVLWSSAGGWREFVVADVPVLAALTLPHVLLVGWLDRSPRAGAPGIRTGDRAESGRR